MCWALIMFHGHNVNIYNCSSVSSSIFKKTVALWGISQYDRLLLIRLPEHTKVMIVFSFFTVAGNQIFEVDNQVA